MRIQALFLCSIFCPLVACGPATLSTSKPGAYEGMVDTDGDGVPDSPDSDGDGIADEDDPNPNTPDDPDEEEEEQASEYEGSYEDGGIELVFDWPNYGESDYCDEAESSFAVSDEGELSGESWCYSYWFEESIEISYSGDVSSEGDIDGEAVMLVWVRSSGGGHGGGWSQEELEFDLGGEFYSSKIVLEWDGEIDYGQSDLDFEGSAWANE